MKTLRTTEIKLVGAFFLVAGLFGFFTFVSIALPLVDLVSILNLFPTLLFALTLYSGYLLLLKENPKGLEIGRAVVALQIIQFHIGGLGYLFVTGVYIFIGFVNLDFATTVGIENTFHVNLSDDTSNVAFRLNILALGVFIYLTRVIKKIQDEEDIREALEELKSKRENETISE
jgi:hypothetical protein